MRILAIRGENLASLAGSFELDFREGPLAEAGLFAITGPTGAGKSTILDALCLALFDEAPRIDVNARALVGREGEDEKDRVRASDVRSLLRRGAGEGMAEVEFADRHGKEWRATWRVRRARGAATGRLQPQTVELVDVASGEPFQGTKTEVLAAIATRLGLRFDQFRQSVLLAQGDFAKFLKANADDRAELLERMTGTEIYSRVSRAAFARRKEKDEAVTRERQALEGIAVLAGEERVAFEAAKGEAEAAEKAADARAGRLAALAVEARVLADLAAERAAREKEEKDALAAEIGAGEARGASELELAAAAGRVTELADERAAVEPQIAKARVLDGELAAEKRTLEALRADETKAVANAGAQGLAARGAADAARENALAVEDSEKALAGMHAAKVLVERRDLWGRALDELERCAAARKEWEKKREAAGGDEAAARKAEALHAAGAADVESALELERAAHARVEAECAAAPSAGLVAAVTEAAGRAAALGRLGAAAKAARSAAARLEGARTEEADARAEAEKAAAEEAAAKAEAERAAIRLDEARRALSGTSAARDLEPRRGDLVAGEPCPLCGATEHPWAERAPVVDALFREQEERVEELEKEKDAARDRAAKAGARRAAESRRMEGAGRRAVDDGRALAEAGEGWSVAREALPAALAERLPEHAADARAVEVVEELEREAADAKEAARERLDAARAREAEEQALRKRIATLEKDRQGRLDAKGTASTAALAAGARREEAEGRLADLGKRVSEELGLLADVLVERPALAGTAEADPRGVRAALEAEAAARVTVEERLAKGREVQAGLDREAEKTSAKAKVATEEAARAGARAREKAGALDVLAGKRRELLAGRPVADVEEEMRARERAAADAAEAARKRRDDAVSALARAEQDARNARTNLEKVREAENAAAGSLAEAFGREGLEGVAALEVARAAATADLKAARERRADAQARLRQDDAALVARKERSAALEAAREAARVWSELDDLIGSREGTSSGGSRRG